MLPSGRKNFEPKATPNITTMKRKYDKPTVKVVELQHRTMLLSGSPLTTTSSNLDADDDFEIEDTPAGNDFWSR